MSKDHFHHPRHHTSSFQRTITRCNLFISSLGCFCIFVLFVFCDDTRARMEHDLGRSDRTLEDVSSETFALESSSSIEKGNLGLPDHTQPSVGASDDPSLLPYVPLYVGSGLGTTGTQSMHEAMCRLGISSVHFSTTCFQDSESGQVRTESIMEGVMAHVQVVKDYEEFEKCFQAKDCTFEQGAEILKRLEDNVAKVVTSGIMAVHDSPYPYMLPFIMDVLRRERGGKPIILFTDRDLDTWVESRVLGPPAEKSVLLEDAKHAWDYGYWLQHLQQGDPNERCSKLFATYNQQVSMRDKEAFKAYFKEAAAYHRKSILDLEPDYQVNLWETPTLTMTEQMLGMDIWNKTKSKLPQEASEQIGQSLKVQNLATLLETWG